MIIQCITGNSRLYPTLKEISITPRTTFVSWNVKGYSNLDGWSKVTVGGVYGLTPENIRKGKQIFGVVGTAE